MLINFLKSIFGPELYRIFRSGQIQEKYYTPNKLELYSNTIISVFRGLYIFCKWTSPVLFAFGYKSFFSNMDGLHRCVKIVCLYALFVSTAHVTRGIGRFLNKDYQTFIIQYLHANNPSKCSAFDRKRFLSKYDFQLKYWTPNYIPTAKPPVFKNTLLSPSTAYKTSGIKYLVWTILSKICVDTFGLKMMYPGVILQNLIKNMLMDGRAKLIESSRAQRCVVQTADKYRNKIDTVFVDQRNATRVYSNKIFSLDRVDSENGNYCVICCDGNASFYENGIFQLPIDNGFSCIGWNYPGFGQSTGSPYPEQLTAAADAMVQYAIHLGFKTENIVLFSWSIGGFAVSWLSNQYPDVKAVILDACFDNIVHLAQQQMPKFASNFVQFAIENNLNLNVEEMLKKYNGKILLIRRTQDEIISTVPKVASHNRGNDLLLGVLKHRYPYIVDKDTLPYMRTWLSAQSDDNRRRIFNSYCKDVMWCESTLASYAKNNPIKYPLSLGKRAAKSESESDSPAPAPMTVDEKLSLSFYLCNKYMTNFESTHCTPLYKEHFKLPWSVHDVL